MKSSFEYKKKRYRNWLSKIDEIAKEKGRGEGAIFYFEKRNKWSNRNGINHYRSLKYIWRAYTRRPSTRQHKEK